MLVYVNQLEFVGEDALTKVLRTIAGWLKQQTGHHFTIDELISGDEFPIDKQVVRTYRADAREPHIYGFLFSNPDSTTRGRQWITEIGVRVENDSVYFTVLLETSEISTRVIDIPTTTKPRLITYLKENCELSPGTEGLNYRTLSCDEDSLRAFLSEVERNERKVPIVLLSPDRSGRCRVSPDTLQGHLLGLARVVVIDEQMDSWLLERELGRRYSAWDGAINIIYPARGRDYCLNKLYLSHELDQLKSEGKNINLDILSRITHFSNGYRKRKHFSPQDVRAKRAADHRQYLQEQYRSAKTQESQDELLREALAQIDLNEQILADLKQKHQQEVDELQSEALYAMEDADEKVQEIWRLNSKLTALENTGGVSSAVLDPRLALETVSSPTPERCLQILESSFSDRIVILDSAWKSCRKSENFNHPQKLANLLLRFATDYYEGISSGPDSEARKVFGDKEFAAQESETVSKNSELLKKRTFEYLGEPVVMLRHLKIGVADNVRETIRVHFHWDCEKGKLVIGYCGPHLPL